MREETDQPMLLALHEQSGNPMLRGQANSVISAGSHIRKSRLGLALKSRRQGTEAGLLATEGLGARPAFQGGFHGCQDTVS